MFFYYFFLLKGQKTFKEVEVLCSQKLLEAPNWDDDDDDDIKRIGKKEICQGIGKGVRPFSPEEEERTDREKRRGVFSLFCCCCRSVIKEEEKAVVERLFSFPPRKWWNIPEERREGEREAEWEAPPKTALSGLSLLPQTSQKVGRASSFLFHSRRSIIKFFFFTQKSRDCVDLRKSTNHNTQSHRRRRTSTENKKKGQVDFIFIFWKVSILPLGGGQEGMFD